MREGSVETFAASLASRVGHQVPGQGNEAGEYDKQGLQLLTFDAVQNSLTSRRSPANALWPSERPPRPARRLSGYTRHGQAVTGVVGPKRHRTFRP